MGVLINKYFKMPKSCDSCHFGQEYECVDEAGYGCLLTMKTRPKGETDRPDYCPLIELPPHGDLIDKQVADELNKKDYEAMGSDRYTDYARSVVLNCLNAAPIIIESEGEE